MKRLTGSSGGTVRRGRGEDGVAIFEAALVTPVLLLMLFGIFEFGLMYRDVLTVGDATNDAVREGGVRGPEETGLDLDDDGTNDAQVSPDYMIVKSVREATASIDPEDIDRIVVFRGDSPRFGSALDQVPDACKTGGSSASLDCNVYPARESFLEVQNGNAAYFECANPGTDTGPACGWPPKPCESGSDTECRSDDPTNPADVDYLGVYIRLERPYVTGLFGDSFTIEQAKIVRLEPGTVE